MLLALIDLAEAGDLTENVVPYAPALLDRYRKYFEIVRTASDHPNSYFPFFHLRSEEFWKLVPLSSVSRDADSMRTARSHSDILNNFSNAALDHDLHTLLQEKRNRNRLRDVLIKRWFPEHAEALHAALYSSAKENEAERALREGTETTSTDEHVRSSAFRRIVLEAYDHRCAATGMRLVVPDVAVLLDAAHLIPFRQSHDDSPNNGMALTPTFHRALDNQLIAPGPDMKWHVSPVLDHRIADYRVILELEGQPVLLPHKERYRPSPEALRWRLERLKG